MKKILFISPPFFEYPLLIKRELGRRFDVVDYYTSYPTHFLYKIAAFLHLRRIQRYISESYNNRIIRNSDVEYDYVFIIKASELGVSFLKNLREKIKAKYVQYIWDDLKFDNRAKETFPYFDRILSFCMQDCTKYKLAFRTNFYDPQECKKQKKDISLFFVGSYKSNRLTFLKKILSQISNEKLPISFYIKCGFVLFLITPSLWRYKRFIVFKPISYKKMMELLGRSVAMIDVAERHQSGLTTRPFEAMAAGTKIITTNQDITNYDFYRQENFIVVSEEHPILNKSWLKEPFKAIPDSIIEKYSIRAFVNDVLE